MGTSGRRARSLRAYVVGLVLLFAAVSAAGAIYEHQAAGHDAARSALQDARYGAGLAARDIRAGLSTLQSTVASLAVSRGIADVFRAPAGCTLTVGAVAPFRTGHLDIVAADGSPLCSSLPDLRRGVYAGAGWLRRALASPAGTVPMPTVPIRDPRTGGLVVLAAAPIGSHGARPGAVVGFLGLDGLGPGLAASLGGPRNLEFLVASADGRTVLARSVDPGHWVGAPAGGTPFARADGPVTRRDLDGNRRLYGVATVDGTGWAVYAGADRGQALAAANRLSRRELWITLAGLLAVLAVAFVLSRRIARPIQRLSAAVRAATGHAGAGPVVVSGPAEVASLAEDFGRLIAAVDRELDAASRLSAIVESSTDAMIGKTLDGRITSWNVGAELMYGYSAGEAIGRNVDMLVPPDRPDELTGILRRVAGGERVEHLETQRRRNDGSLLDVSVTVSPVRNAAGTIVGASSVARDITDSRRAVEAVRASEARKTAILQSALDCVITIDQHGRVVEFNPAAESTFGWPRAAVLGRTMADLIVPPALRDAHRAGLARHLATGTGTILGRRLELTALRADGTEFPVEVAISRVDLPGAPLFTGYLRDITERKRAEAERQSLEERLHQSQRLESLGQLAGGVAHDFNNLLAVILNYASFVAERTAEDSQVGSDVEQIRRAAERAARLTRQLLIFGRRERVQPEVLDLNAVVSDVRNLLSRSIGEHVELAVHPASTELAIRADRGQLEQVLLNLAVNARDAMPDGGTLTIETGTVLLDEEYVRLHPDVVPGRYVQLSISDTGVGMSPEVLARVFEPFFTTKPKGHGSGLGLATVYGIVADAGGAVSVYSEEGLGTTVRARFPVVDEPVPASTPAAAGAPIRGRGETILVVEDEEAMRKVTCRMLRRNGYVVLEAAGAPEALSLAVDNDCRLLLTDVVMPQLSGRELAEAVHRSRPDLPVLFMSGYSAGVLGPHRAVDDGIVLIQKPFDERTLLDRVHAALAAAPVGVRPGGR